MDTSVWSTECHLRYRLPADASVFTAALFATARDIEYAEYSIYKNFILFSDSQSALQAIESCKTNSNESLFNIIIELNDSAMSFSLIWVLGHCRIFGNKQVDVLAKSAV